MADPTLTYATLDQVHQYLADTYGGDWTEAIDVNLVKRAEAQTDDEITWLRPFGAKLKVNPLLQLQSEQSQFLIEAVAEQARELFQRRPGFDDYSALASQKLVNARLNLHGVRGPQFGDVFTHVIDEDSPLNDADILDGGQREADPFEWE